MPSSWVCTASAVCSDPWRSDEYIGWYAGCQSSVSIGVAETRGTVPSPPMSSPPWDSSIVRRSPSQRPDCFVPWLIPTTEWIS